MIATRFGGLALCLVTLGGMTLPVARGAMPPVRLRLEWGGGQPREWNMRVGLSDGTLQQPRPLGIETDDPGSARLAGGVVTLARRAPRAYDGLDVTALAPPDAQLQVELSGNGEARRFRFRILDLCDRVVVRAVDEDGASLVVRRAPGDALSVHVDRNHLIYSPNDLFRARVRHNFISSRARTVRGTLAWTLRPARSTTVLANGSTSVVLETNREAPEKRTIEVTLPGEEGVYDLVCRFRDPGGIDERITTQVVVLDEEPASHTDEPFAVRRVDAFEPRRAGYFRRLHAGRRNRLLSGSLKGISRLVPRLSPEKEQPAKIPWQAYQLHVKRVQKPHRLTVVVPEDVAQRVGVSIIEPNAAGQFMPVGLDSGVVVPKKSRPESGAESDEEVGSLRHEIVFWPKVRDPVLLVYPLEGGGKVDLRRVELDEFNRLPRPLVDPPEHASRLRLIGPYLHKPLLPENFGGTEVLDEAGGRSLDDWQTFLDASRRFTSWLRARGDNAALVTVAADGSAIYPSRLLQPSPRYDTGEYSVGGHDPIRKDVLELLLALFEREGLHFVAHLRFGSPLPVLERRLAARPEDSRGIELVGRDGRTWRERSGTLRGPAPIYNPLDPRVQQAVRDVVQELIDRYDGRPALAGVSLELSRYGYLQLPGLEWGYDAATVARFSRDTGISVPGSSKAKRFSAQECGRCYRFLTTTARDHWVAWRAAEIGKFHRALAEIVTASSSTMRCLLSANRIVAPAGARGMPRSLHSGPMVKQAALERGLDGRNYSNVKRLTLLHPVLADARTASSPTLHAADLSRTSALRRGFELGSLGTLLYRRPLEFRLADFDEASPWQPAFTWLTAQPRFFDGSTRKRFIGALASYDVKMLFDGGWMVPQPLHDENDDVRRVLRELPAVRFKTSPHAVQPAVIRVGHADGKTYVYAVNDFPDEIDVLLWLSCDPRTHGRRLDASEPLALRRSRKAGSYVTLNMAPYGLAAFQLDEADVRLVDARVTLTRQALAAMRNRIDSLARGMQALDGMVTPQRSPLANPGFEVAAGRGSALPGWDVSGVDSAGWMLDGSAPRSGRSALKLTAAETPAAIQSRALKLEGNRFLSMSLWLRSDRDAADVRLAFTGTLDGKPQTQYAKVKVGKRWRRYLFRVREIPPERLADARVRVEVRDGAELWIDDVDIKLHQLTEQDARQLTKVHSAISLAWEEHRYADCRRLLESYWGRYLVTELATDEAGEHTVAKPESRELKKLFRR